MSNIMEIIYLVELQIQMGVKIFEMTQVEIKL